MRRAGEKTLVDQFMQQAINAWETSRPISQSPGQSAKRTAWRTSGAPPVTWQDDQLEVSPAGA
eukprot:9452923-Pyramimonas_sp.AAC.1